MEMPLADVVDRYTVLILKDQNGIPVKEELEQYRKCCMNLEWKELLRINSLMWKLEEMISDETDLATIGALYLALRGLTKRRVEAKNQIAVKHQQPPEVKSY